MSRHATRYNGLRLKTGSRTAPDMTENDTALNQLRFLLLQKKSIHPTHSRYPLE